MFSPQKRSSVTGTVVQVVHCVNLGGAIHANSHRFKYLVVPFLEDCNKGRYRRGLSLELDVGLRGVYQKAKGESQNTTDLSIWHLVNIY